MILLILNWGLWMIGVLPGTVALVLGGAGGMLSLIGIIGHVAVSNSQRFTTLGQIEPETETVIAPHESIEITVRSETLPDIDVKIIEAFINPFIGGALCFVQCSLHNPTNVQCDVPRIGYSLSLLFDNKQATYETAKTVEVFTNYYLMVYEEDQREDYFKELSRDNVLLPPRGTLRRGKPVFGWLGFEIRGLPPWTEHKEPTGTHQEEIVDEDGRWIGVEEVVDFDTYFKTDTVQAITLTVTDPFGFQHHATKTAPFHDEGRAIMKEKK